LEYTELNENDLAKYVAGKIAQDKIIGWFRGRMEFGPRALGNRSIIANPCNPRMKDLLNNKVKHREPFRPFAPVVLEEKAEEYFEIRGRSSFMLLSPKVRETKKKLIPAVTHADGTARLQTINETANPVLWKLIKEFESITSVPMLINTSFNIRGDPIVCTPEDAIKCFLSTDLDYLVLGNCIVEK
jgi:carbamoyltransferase